MKAISLLQPWATLVVMGVKTIETRNLGTINSAGIYHSFIKHFTEQIVANIIMFM